MKFFIGLSLVFFQCLFPAVIFAEQNKALVQLRNQQKEIVIFKAKAREYGHQLFAILGENSQGLIWDAHLDFKVLDINLDGDDELLVSTHSGGNCCPSNLLIYYYSSSEDLLKEFSFGEWNAWDSWDGITITSENERAILTGVNDISRSDVLKHSTISYLFDGNAIILHSITEKVELPALNEIRSENFYDRYEVGGKARLHFDLNNDGVQDTISCGFWERWGDLTNCKIEISLLGENELDFSGKRVGILESRKNGYNMLVINHDNILFFDPEKNNYVQFN